jgi:ankyrin repeat protein
VSPPQPPEAQEVDTTWVHTVDLHATDNRGYTALHHAATQGLYDVAVILIERGAEIDATARSGATPLMLAARAGRWKVGHLLLAYGADAYRQDCYKLNACEYARRAGNYRMSALF